MSTEQNNADYNVDENILKEVNIVVGKVNEKYLISKIKDNQIVDSLITEIDIPLDRLLSCCKVLLHSNSVEAASYLTSTPN